MQRSYFEETAGSNMKTADEETIYRYLKADPEQTKFLIANLELQSTPEGVVNAWKLIILCSHYNYRGGATSVKAKPIMPTFEHITLDYNLRRELSPEAWEAMISCPIHKDWNWRQWIITTNNKYKNDQKSQSWEYAWASWKTNTLRRMW